VSSAPITLFVDAFFCTPFDFRVWVALHEKGLDFTSSRVMVTPGEGLSVQYKRNSLTARVPGLAHGDFWVAESVAIVEYLEEAFPPPIWPRLHPDDLRLRARARQLSAFLLAELDVLIAERPSWMVFYPSSPAPLSPRARASAEEMLGVATQFAADGALATWSLACADLTFALLRLSRTGEVLAPELQGLVDENLERPSVKSYMEHTRPPNPPLTGRRSEI
jgi:glutathione S-transferase